MKRHHSLTIATDTLEALDRLPIARSKAISQALAKAGEEPDLLVHALRLRLSQPPVSEMTKVTYSRDDKLGVVIEKLAEMSKLSGEQVVRLSVEAYIHRL